MHSESTSNTGLTETTGDNDTMTNTTKTTETAGRNVERDFRGAAWSNETHASLTDPEERLFRKGKGKPAQLCFMGHALMENRNGFVVEAEMTHADGYGERSAAIAILHAHDPGSTRRLTLGADKGYDEAGFVADLKAMCVTPHIAAKKKGSAIDGRTTIRKTMLRGLSRVRAQFTLTMAAYNLAKLPNLLAA